MKGLHASDFEQDSIFIGLQGICGLVLYILLNHDQRLASLAAPFKDLALVKRKGFTTFRNYATILNGALLSCITLSVMVRTILYNQNQATPLRLFLYRLAKPS
jgi:hypothetical protein